jgi:hypothetical protein
VRALVTPELQRLSADVAALRRTVDTVAAQVDAMHALVRRPLVEQALRVVASRTPDPMKRAVKPLTRALKGLLSE